MLSSRLVSVFLTAALAFAAAPAIAQSDYPTKPIRLVVGFSAGGISDVLGRALAAKMSQTIG